MGIYFNEKLLYPKKDGNEIEQRYYTEMSEIDKLFSEKKEITIVRHAEKQWDKDHTSFRPIPPYALPKEIPIYMDSIGAVSIRYSESPPQRNGKNITWPTTKKLFMEERMTLTPKDKDLVWYLLKATNFVRNENNKDAFMWVDDPQKILAEKASDVKRIVQVDRLLLDDDSPLANASALKLIADRFDIDISGKNPDVAAYLIRETVLESEKAKNPDINVDIFLSFAKTIASKINGKKAKKEESADGENPESAEDKSVYTKEFLESLETQALNGISKTLGTQKPPQVNKAAQIEQILAKQ